MRTKQACAAAALIAAAIPLTATLGAAATVACGQVVTQSVTLSADVGPCPNDGIVVGADNITIDLGGRAVTGAPGRFGIWSKDRTGVVVQNGRITGFEAGVVIEGGSRNTVQRIVAHDNIGAFQKSNFGTGILVLESNDNVIQDNRAIHNGPLAGIEVAGTALRNLIQRNDATRNDIVGPGGTSEGKGISVRGITAARVPLFTTVQYNRAVSNGHVGIYLGSRATDSRILNNVAHRNGLVFAEEFEQPGAGIEIGSRAFRTLVQGNVSTENGGDGIIQRGTVAFPQVDLGNRVLGNTFLRNGQAGEASSFLAFDIHEQNRFCFGTVWQGNRFESTNFVGADCIH